MIKLLHSKLVFCFILLISFSLTGCGVLSEQDIQSLMEEISKSETSDEKEKTEEQLETFTTIEDLAKYVEKQLKQKKNRVKVKLEGIGETEFSQINQYINSCWGSCNKYQQRTVNGVNTDNIYEIELEISDETYVYDAICNGGDIKQAPESAQKLYKKVKKILKNKVKKSMSDYKKEFVFYKYLINNCTYNTAHADSCDCEKISSGEPATTRETDSSHTAYGALVEGNPVCSGYARAFNLLLACEDIPCKIVSGRADGENHGWNLVKLDKKWYQVDITWDDTDNKRKLDYFHFNITDNMMAETHNWNQDLYPKANGKKYNYYRQNKKFFTKKKQLKDDMYQSMIHSGKNSYTALMAGFQINNNDMEFIFEGNSRYQTVRWKIAQYGKYRIIRVSAK